MIVSFADRRPADESQRTAADERLDFERFAAELSGRFINPPGAEANDVVRDGLRRICSLLGVDRGTLYKLTSDTELVEALGWSAPGIPHDAGTVSAMERFPWAMAGIAAGEATSFSTVADVANEVDREVLRRIGIKSAVVVPVPMEGRIAGAIAFDAIRAERGWPPDTVRRLGLIAGMLGHVLARHQRDEAIQAARAEAERLKDELQVENVSLRREARERFGLTRVVGRSAAVRRVLEQIDQVAATDSTVLLLGETGTGKELFATRIHELGGRHTRPMVRVNCAAIPSTLMESELFGREKGAFTGALARQVGRFELAHRSTIFLDEIGDLPGEVQVKLLRVLEERQIERLGSPRPIAVDTRIIAATHRNLEQRIADGSFREDLYYRLNVFPIQVPPLRERVEDIPLLVWRFVEEFSTSFGKRIDAIDRDSLTVLQQYSWPGNIRELRNVVERAMIVATGKRLVVPVPHSSAAASARRGPKLIDLEKEHIRTVLAGTAWRIRGHDGAAERLGLKPTTLETRMAKLGIKRPSHA